MKKENKKIIIIVIILLLIITCILLGYLLSNKNKVSNEVIESFSENEIHISSYYSNINEEENKIEPVKDRNDFFTVQSCVNKYLIYVTQKDTSNLYKLLDERYIKEFNITEQNILDHVEDLSGDAMFKAKKMYYEKIAENVYTYYISGEVAESYMGEEEPNKEEMNITVNTDINNMTFSIVPFGYGGIFDNEEN